MNHLPPLDADQRHGSPNSQENEPVLLLTGAEAAALCRTSIRSWRSWDAGGRVPKPVRLGRSKLWRSSELHDWIIAGCPPRNSWHWNSHSAAI